MIVLSYSDILVFRFASACSYIVFYVDKTNLTNCSEEEWSFLRGSHKKTCVAQDGTKCDWKIYCCLKD